MTTSTRPAPHTEPLDSFETALLAMLRAEVAERATAPSEVAARPARYRTRRVVGLAAAAAAVAVALPLTRGTPAYAVATEADGDVVVTVARLDDAPGLEQALRDHGVPARVTFVPEGQQCDPRDNPPVRRGGPLALDVRVDAAGLHFTVPAGSVAADQTLLVDLSSPTPLRSLPGGQAGLALGAYVTANPATQCRLIDSTAIVPAPGQGEPRRETGSGGSADSGSTSATVG